MVLLLGLVVHYAGTGDGRTAIVAAAVLVASVLTSYAKARAETQIEKLEGGLLERGERIGLLAAGAILGVMQPVLWLLAAGTIYTVAQRFGVAYRELGKLDAAAETRAGEGAPRAGGPGEALEGEASRPVAAQAEPGAPNGSRSGAAGGAR